MSRVAVVKGQRGLEPVYRALDLVPFKESLGPHDTVLIKPNLIESCTYETGVTTDPIVVEAVIRKVQELDKRAIVVETDAGTTSPDKAIHVTGMMEVIEKLDSEYVNMRKLKDKVELSVEKPRKVKKFKVAKIAVESAIITVPTMKTFYLTDISMGLKNMFGMLTTRQKHLMHRHGMHNVIHDICKTLPPTLSVIDGFYGKSGRNPSKGPPVKMDTIIASSDPVAADAVAARCIGIDPLTIDHVRWLHEAGMGEITEIEILGDGVEAVFQKWNREAC